MQICVDDVLGGCGKQVSIKSVFSEIFIGISLPFMVSVMCSFIAVKGNCHSHMYMSTETIWRSVFVVRIPHYGFMFLLVL
jgi:hypothetical protein